MSILCAKMDMLSWCKMCIRLVISLCFSVTISYQPPGSAWAPRAQGKPLTVACYLLPAAWASSSMFILWNHSGDITWSLGVLSATSALSLELLFVLLIKRQRVWKVSAVSLPLTVNHAQACVECLAWPWKLRILRVCVEGSAMCVLVCKRSILCFCRQPLRPGAH